MKSIEAIATLAHNGELKVQAPPGIKPGKHRVVLVVDENTTDDTVAISDAKLLPSRKFWTARTLNDIRLSQRVKPAIFKSLLGGWPTDRRHDGFEKRIEKRRQTHRKTKSSGK